MSITTIIVEGLAPIAVGALIASVLAVVPLAIDSAKSNWRKRFRQQLKLGVARETVTFNDLEHLAERWNQDRKAVLQSLRVLLSEALSGEDSELSSHVEKLRSLLAQHESREPYAELPENISLQLAGISATAPSVSGPIGQLAASLGDLYSSNQRDLSRQKKLSFWGFVVGVVGLVLSVPGLYLAFRG